MNFKAIASKFVVFLLLTFSLTSCTDQEIRTGLGIAEEVISEITQNLSEEEPEEVLYPNLDSNVPIAADDVDMSWFGEDVPYVVLNDNRPYFTETTTEVFEFYSELDDLGRCGEAFANICPELMPTEKRESIGMIKPSGWHTVRYDDLISDKYLYNRCHLIGFQLAGENANPLNLITGTRFLNVTGMLPFENEIADYVKETGNHVMYRVTPLFSGDDLVAKGVLMEAFSVEDSGEGVCFCVFCGNIQPGVEIDYTTGESSRK